MTADPSIRENAQPITLDDLPAADWISVTRCPYGVARVRTYPGDGTLMVRARGGGEPWPGNWGEVPADGVYELRSGAGYAFTATYTGPATTVRLQTNLAHGVMAVHAFHHFTDDSGRRDYYTREFYVTGGDALPATSPFPASLSSGRNDPRPLWETWTVLDRENAQIERLSLALDCGATTVRASAIGPEGGTENWGAANATIYADAAVPDGPPAFLATFELDDRRVHVQGRDFLGVLVVQQYIAYTDGSGRRDYFTRDCFRR
ncbi:MAG: hypothetical protein GEV11_11325 [Streptosporangiales bacterium]|nr:hypothetical protein [Streptosporangiales bacterium]